MRTTIWVGLRDAALDHRPARLQPLPDGLQSELLEVAERGKVRGVENSVGHVEVFRRTVSAGTPILEDLDPRPANAARTPAPPATAKSRLPAHASGADDE